MREIFKSLKGNVWNYPNSAINSTTTMQIKRRSSTVSEPRVLVTGGAGYIGSHTTLSLLQSGYKVVIIDNLRNSYRESVERVVHLANVKSGDVIFVKGSVDNKVKLEKIFTRYNIASVIHFAGLKSVSESLTNPLDYYHNNVTATCVLLQCMKKYNCNRIVFSSSATVYGNAIDPYIKEDAPTSPMTPYGRSKLMCEDIILDSCNGNSKLCAVILRYFNPVGCHESGLIGENPKNAPNNLMPCVTNAMMTKQSMQLYGDDYKTDDGTAVRDFIHVCDLADGHVSALRKLEGIKRDFCQIYNMGNGKGSSVKQVIETMEKVSGVEVPHEIVNRRPGDAECVVADPTKAFDELTWKPKHNLEEMCGSAWKWKAKNPNGYAIDGEEISDFTPANLLKHVLVKRLRAASLIVRVRSSEATAF